MFSEKELEYLRSQPLARLATVDGDDQPTVDAVGSWFDSDNERFYVGGRNLPATRKYKNVVAGNRKVSLIVDDLASRDPWTPRGIRVHGDAKIVRRDAQFGPGEYLEIAPAVSWSWGLEDREDFREGGFAPKKRVWEDTYSERE